MSRGCSSSTLSCYLRIVCLCPSFAVLWVLQLQHKGIHRVALIHTEIVLCRIKYIIKGSTGSIRIMQGQLDRVSSPKYPPLPARLFETKHSGWWLRTCLPESNVYFLFSYTALKTYPLTKSLLSPVNECLWQRADDVEKNHFMLHLLP